MSLPQDSKAYSQGIGTTRVNANTVVQQRAPATSDWNYQIGTVWLDQTNIAEYTLLSISSFQGISSATWLASGGGATGVATINTLVPSGGNITIAGTANQVSIANAGSTVTLSTPSAFIAPGSIAATTTVTATLGAITATNGNIVLGTAGNKIISSNVASTTTAGANAFGKVTLVAGTATISTTAVTASSIIMLTRQSPGSTGAAALGMLSVGTISAGVSFIINSLTTADSTGLATTDVSSIGWMIIN